MYQFSNFVIAGLDSFGSSNQIKFVRLIFDNIVANGNIDDDSLLMQEQLCLAIVKYKKWPRKIQKYNP